MQGQTQKTQSLIALQEAVTQLIQAMVQPDRITAPGMVLSKVPAGEDIAAYLGVFEHTAERVMAQGGLGWPRGL